MIVTDCLRLNQQNSASALQARRGCFCNHVRLRLVSRAALAYAEV